MFQKGIMKTNTETADFDYQYVHVSARVAVYDDMLSSPQIIDIEPAPTRDFINNLAVTIYNNAKQFGGEIPYSIILQVAENFIHSRFTEVVVSVLDSGNTIRFSDQGPGIADKEKAQQPGFSSATSEMKEIIHGVGSGLPIVSEYMQTRNGLISIEDNIGTGAVVTISLNPKSTEPEINQEARMASGIAKRNMLSENLSTRSFSILSLFKIENIWGVKDISEELNMPLSSTHAELKKLEEAGMITKLGKKRILTELGGKVVDDVM